MELTEIAPLEATSLPVAELAAHLRLGTGFADDAVEMPGVESAIRAAIGVVERRTGRATIARGFVWRPGRCEAALPLIPVASVDAVAVVEGEALVVMSGWRLVGERITGLPGDAEVTLTLGYGAWAEVPPDLRQAAILIGAALYEARGGVSPEMPGMAAALMAPWRRLRIGGAA